MKILGIDSSGMVASVAVLDEETVLAEYTINHKKTHSQTLLPMLDEVVSMLELDLKEIDAIAVAEGPGSFTGLRIGAATVKGMGEALSLPIVAVPTLDAMAYNFYGAKGIICPIMDARRNQVYTGIYSFNPVLEDGNINMEFSTLMVQCAISVDELCERIRNGNYGPEPVIFLGDGVPVFRDFIIENLGVPCYFAPAHMSRQRGAALAALGIRYFKEGRYKKAGEFRPEYLRMSQAERERSEKISERDGRDYDKMKNSVPSSKMSDTSTEDESLYFRTMERADIEFVVPIEQECFSEPWSEKSFLDAMENKNNIYVVAQKGSEIAGYCGIWGVSHEGQICNVAVKEKYRKNGIAYAMLSSALKESEQMGNSEFTLEVREGNEAAIALYEKLGFKKEGVRKNFYKNPSENGIIMWKR